MLMTFSLWNFCFSVASKKKREKCNLKSWNWLGFFWLEITFRLIVSPRGSIGSSCLRSCYHTWGSKFSGFQPVHSSMNHWIPIDLLNFFDDHSYRIQICNNKVKLLLHPKVINFLRYYTKSRGKKETLCEIFRVVSRFPLHFV